MSRRNLSEQQLAAVVVLSQPKRGGLTYAEVADEVGVSLSTLNRWRNDDAFNEEVKKHVLRNAVGRLPDIFDSVPTHIIEEGNAAMLRTYLQALGMLTERVEVDNKADSSGDIDDMKAKIERMRGRDE